MAKKQNSIIFTVTVVYIIITVLNIAIFSTIHWENQIGLIIDNAILDSQYKGSSINYAISKIVTDTTTFSNSVKAEIKIALYLLDVQQFGIFTEDGKTIFSNQNINTRTKEMVKLINKSITKRNFEDRLFTHRVNQKEKTIDLFVPFTDNTEKSFVLMTTLKMDDIDAQIVTLYKQTVVITAITILLHLLFASFIDKIFIKPMHLLIGFTKKVAKGDFDSQVPNFGNNELGLLASSFNEMSSSISHMQNEALGANPLTGLPGNITISAEIDERIANNRKFAVLYCDLDNFKAYNDKYGFIKGDDAILYSRNKLKEAAESLTVHDIFVGHEGGDDFVVITPLDCWEEYAQGFIQIFDKDISQFYNSEDVAQKFISSVDRNGNAQIFPLMSMSVAVVTNEHHNFTHHGEVIQVAAEVKKYAKQQVGSAYKVNRRL